MSDLRESKEVNELLETLEQNGMNKEKSEVNALIDYIGDMEKTLSAMLTEMVEMRKEVNLIHDNTLRAKCGALVQNADTKIRQGIATISKVKDNFIESCKNAVQTFKTKGKEAFQNAMRKMMIPETLDKLGDIFHRLSESMRKDVQNIQTAREEYSASKLHKSNAIRSLFGKKPVESETVKNDRGILAKAEAFIGKLARGVSSLETKTNNLADKIRVDRVKESVRTELDFFKGNTDVKDISSRSMER